MGSDIYMYQEKQIDDEWKVVNNNNKFFRYDMNITRNPELFGYLAGIRIPHPQARTMRGMPDNASSQVKSLRLSTTEYPQSWISLIEIREAILTLTITGGTHDNSGVIYGLNEILEKMIKGLESDKYVRFIFWFD